MLHKKYRSVCLSEHSGLFPGETDKMISEFIEASCQPKSPHATPSSIILKSTKIQQDGMCRDFPGGPVVKTPCFHCRGHGSDPWSGPRGTARRKKKKDGVCYDVFWEAKRKISNVLRKYPGSLYTPSSWSSFTGTWVSFCHSEHSGVLIGPLPRTESLFSANPTSPTYLSYP